MSVFGPNQGSYYGEARFLGVTTVRRLFSPVPPTGLA